ncbi:Hypothetical protein SMAX5B_016563 [Scophthalmus maximus]|uniref:Uncharacterized protein n=1 Tax=Scophthalmus maximus TaxID=52904 RepID=A0A2U9BSC1_SCOMX|nr:Hypothetical protein SMAX5B_016563 [Scophthalmus maximus]
MPLTLATLGQRRPLSLPIPRYPFLSVIAILHCVPEGSGSRAVTLCDTTQEAPGANQPDEKFPEGLISQPLLSRVHWHTEDHFRLVASHRAMPSLCPLPSAVNTGGEAILLPWVVQGTDTLCLRLPETGGGMGDVSEATESVRSPLLSHRK